MPALTHIALHVRDLEANLRFYESICGLHCVHRRGHPEVGEVAWLAEPGRENDFVFVFISGGPERRTEGSDFSHRGFALETREAVDEVAQRGEEAGCLVWAPREEPFPVGYYCGLEDPDGNVVEFSFGQPLGPGSRQLEASRSSR